jgi:5-methylcytosine-specific restriction endonuclease McrA
MHEYRQKNKEKIKIQKRKWNKEHPESKKKTDRMCYLKRTAGKIKIRNDGRSLNKKYRSWMKNKRNRVLKRIIKENGSHTFGEWETLKKMYNYKCPCCGKSEPEVSLTEDHIVPLSKGGGDNIENIQPLCLSCNCKKHTKIIKY